MAIKQKHPNDGIREFVLRGFDADNNVVGRFDDGQIEKLAVRHHPCSNGAAVCIDENSSGLII